MGRRPGSLNKSTIIKMQQHNNKGGGVSIMHFDKQIENSAIVRPNAQYGIMNWGRDNLYAYKLIDLYNTSVTHKACCDFMTNAAVGEGIDWEAMQVKNGDILSSGSVI